MINTARGQLQNYVKVMRRNPSPPAFHHARPPLLLCCISYITRSPAQDQDHGLMRVFSFKRALVIPKVARDVEPEKGRSVSVFTLQTSREFTGLSYNQGQAENQSYLRTRGDKRQCLPTLGWQVSDGVSRVEATGTGLGVSNLVFLVGAANPSLCLIPPD